MSEGFQIVAEGRHGSSGWRVGGGVYMVADREQRRPDGPRGRCILQRSTLLIFFSWLLKAPQPSAVLCGLLTFRGRLVTCVWSHQPRVPEMLTLQWVTGWWLAGTVTVLFWEYSHLPTAEEVSWNCTLESWNTEKNQNYNS